MIVFFNLMPDYCSVILAHGWVQPGKRKTNRDCVFFVFRLNCILMTSKFTECMTVKNKRKRRIPVICVWLEASRWKAPYGVQFQKWECRLPEELLPHASSVLPTCTVPACAEACWGGTKPKTVQMIRVECGVSMALVLPVCYYQVGVGRASCSQSTHTRGLEFYRKLFCRQ